MQNRQSLCPPASRVSFFFFPFFSSFRGLVLQCVWIDPNTQR